MRRKLHNCSCHALNISPGDIHMTPIDPTTLATRLEALPGWTVD